MTFVPHLVPLDRGILETIYAKVPAGTTAEQVSDAFERTYGQEPFVRLTGEALPEIKHVAWTNFCESVGGSIPARDGWSSWPVSITW